MIFIKKMLNNKVVFLLLGILLLFYWEANAKDEAKKWPYEMLSEQEIKKKTLKELLILRSEPFAARGYVFESQFLKTEMEKREWYKPTKNYSSALITEEEKLYIELLTKRIEELKKIELTRMINLLQQEIDKRLTVKFSLLADLDGDGEYDLITVCGKKFDLKKKQKIRDEGYANYYNKPNELYLIVKGGKGEQAFSRQFKISSAPFGIAEYISNLSSGFYLGDGKNQIKIIIHSFSLDKTQSASHQETLYLFNVDNQRVIKIFSHDIYSSTIVGNKENMIKWDYQFKNGNNGSWKDIELTKITTNRIYNSIQTTDENYSEAEFKEKPIVYRYNPAKMQFGKISK